MATLSPNPSHVVEELATLALRVKPGLLVLYHQRQCGRALTLADPEEALLKGNSGTNVARRRRRCDDGAFRAWLLAKKLSANASTWLPADGII